LSKGNASEKTAVLQLWTVHVISLSFNMINQRTDKMWQLIYWNTRKIRLRSRRHHMAETRRSNMSVSTWF